MMGLKDSINMKIYLVLSAIQPIELFILGFGLDYLINMEKEMN